MKLLRWKEEEEEGDSAWGPSPSKASRVGPCKKTHPSRNCFFKTVADGEIAATISGAGATTTGAARTTATNTGTTMTAAAPTKTKGEAAAATATVEDMLLDTTAAIE